MSEPKVGQYLYATCSAEDYGRILSVGVDDNGVPTIDIEVFHPNDLISCDDEDDGFNSNGLESLEVPEGVKLILRNLQWKDKGDGFIRCNTPANHCYRCTKLFILRDTPSE